MIIMNELPTAGVGKILIREYSTEELRVLLNDSMGLLDKDRSPVTVGVVVDVCSTLENPTVDEGDLVFISRLSRSPDRIFRYDGKDYSLITDPRLINFILRKKI